MAIGPQAVFEVVDAFDGQMKYFSYETLLLEIPESPPLGLATFTIIVHSHQRKLASFVGSTKPGPAEVT